MSMIQIVIGLLTSTAVISIEGPDKPPTHVVLTTPVAVHACTSNCWNGDGTLFCPQGQHKAPDNPGDNFHEGEPHDDCHSGDCQTWHDDCEPTDDFDSEDLEELRLAIVNGDGVRLSRLLDAFQQSLYLNTDRGAVQVLGCEDRVVAHLPVGDNLIAAALAP